MLKCIEFPDKVFASKSEMFHALKANEKNIIAIKKATIQKSYKKGNAGLYLLDKSVEVETKGIHLKDGFIYPVINTTLYRDSHKDVHLNGIWNRSAKEQDGKIYYVSNHTLSLDSIIAWPSDVKVMVKSVPWAFLGKDYPGNTEALIFEIDKKNLKHQKYIESIEEKRPLENSVSMRYVTITLAINSTEKEFAENKIFYDTHIDTIANKDEVEEDGHFWGVGEAKIVTEGSSVIKGSNPVTPNKEKSGADTITPEIKVHTEADTITSNSIHRRLI